MLHPGKQTVVLALFARILSARVKFEPTCASTIEERMREFGNGFDSVGPVRLVLLAAPFEEYWIGSQSISGLKEFLRFILGVGFED
jgi:hypothetical protein